MREGARDARGRRAIEAITFATIVAASLGISTAAVSADTKIEGNSNALSLTVDHDAPIDEVLSALSAKFDLEYTQMPGLDRRVAGMYSGNLQQVLERILDGCNYVMSYSDDKIEIRILGRSNAPIQPPTNAAVSAGATIPLPGQPSASASAASR
jgi:hypothetical protein